MVPWVQYYYNRRRGSVALVHSTFEHEQSKKECSELKQNATQQSPPRKVGFGSALFWLLMAYDKNIFKWSQLEDKHCRDKLEWVKVHPLLFYASKSIWNESIPEISVRQESRRWFLMYHTPGSFMKTSWNQFAPLPCKFWHLNGCLLATHLEESIHLCKFWTLASEDIEWKIIRTF